MHLRLEFRPGKSVYGVTNDGETAMPRTPATRLAETPRMAMVWQVLEGAKDAGDAMVVAAGRRLIAANRLGWKKYAQPADVAIVRNIADA